MHDQSVQRLYEEVLQCEVCPKFTARYRFAPHCHGQGRLGIMIIGQCPSQGSVEAGRYYNQGSMRGLVQGILNLDRDCYLSDVIKCDTTYSTIRGNAESDLASLCGSRFLKREIELLRPHRIIAVGKHSFEYLTGVTGGFTERQNDGRDYYYTGADIPVHPIIHPSHANQFYGRVPHQTQQTYSDNVRQILRDCLENEAPKPREMIPRLFEAYIGGWGGPSYRVNCIDGTLQYTSMGNPQENAAIVPSPESWNKFWVSLDSINVWIWQERYDNPDICDGTHWEIKIEIGNRRVVSSGSNAYPPKGSSSESRNFKAFCKAVSALVEGKAFK